MCFEGVFRGCCILLGAYSASGLSGSRVLGSCGILGLKTGSGRCLLGGFPRGDPKP